MGQPAVQTESLLRQQFLDIYSNYIPADFCAVQTEQPYDMIHITPPMNTPPALGQNKQLADEAGFLKVNKETLQHVK
jgi:hypothetical protein